LSATKARQAIDGGPCGPEKGPEARRSDGGGQVRAEILQTLVGEVLGAGPAWRKQMPQLLRIELDVLKITVGDFAGAPDSRAQIALSGIWQTGAGADPRIYMG
jgi:hypothetical protein